LQGDLTQQRGKFLLQQTQFFIALYSPESTHAAGSRWHFK